MLGMAMAARSVLKDSSVRPELNLVLRRLSTNVNVPL
jgi:hypothetical protein